MRSATLYRRVFSAVLVFAMALAPEFASAQDAQPAIAQPSAGTATAAQSPETQSQPSQQRPGSGTVDPSAPPLAPSQQQPQEQLPSAPSSTQQGTAQPGKAQQSPSQPKPTEPLGTAAAESVRTVGGGASRPAGTAIAPAKQRQRRSLLIKIGAVAAVGAAAGIVYGLTRATSSVPPNTR